MTGHGYQYPRTAPQRRHIKTQNPCLTVFVYPRDAGLPRWSWWTAPWPRDVFYALAAIEAKRMQVSQLGRWLEPPVVQ